MGNSRFLPLSLGLLLVVSACATYRPLVLDGAAVDRELASPPDDVLKVRAESIDHPILKPLRVELSDGLSPEEAGVLAVLLNPSLRAERDRRALADAQLLEAGLLPDPQLSTGLDVPAFGATSGEITALSAGIDQDLRALVTRDARRAGAEANRRSVDLSVAWAEWSAALAAKIAVYHVAGIEARLRVATEVKHERDENLDVVRRAVEAGQLTELDLAAAQAAARDAEAARLDLLRQSREARVALNRALGLPPDRRLEIPAAVLPEKLDPPPADRLVAGLAERRPDLVALHFGYESQEQAVRTAILEQFPSFSLGGSVARDTGNVGTIGLGLSIGIPLFDRNRGAIAAERATRRQLFDEYVDRVYQARCDVAASLATIRSLNEQVAAAKVALPELEGLVTTYRTAVENGQADVLTAYQAAADLAARRMELLSFEESLAVERTSLELATGIYRIESPGDGKEQR